MASDGSFVPPDTSVPIDLEAHLARIPEHATNKGLFIADVTDLAKKLTGKTVGRAKYHGFKDYPFQEWVSVLVEASQLCFPDVPVREAIRRLGQRAYPAFVDSLAGKVLFGIIGRDLKRAIGLSPKAFAVSSNIGRAFVQRLDDGEAILELREMWDFPEAYSVGVYEGGMVALGVEGTVEVRQISDIDIDLRLRW